MKKFIANRLIDGQINTIIGVLDLVNLTYTEDWYFDGKIYSRKIEYNENTKDAEYDFNLACKVFSKDDDVKLILL